MIQSGIHKPKINITTDENYKSVKKMVQESYLNTVCAEARCPNIYECWNRKTATLMILGDTCTRGCGFCSIKTGRPTWNDPLEPYRVAQAVQKMKLRHVVITSVDRDDLKGDYGSTIWAQTINATRKLNPECTIEVLTPDFKGDKNALNTVFESQPDIFSNNVECVERISKGVRDQANWQRSLNVLKESKKKKIANKICDECFAKGLIVIKTGREALKIAPPLTISKEALEEGISVIGEAIKKFYN